jgi:hypothetical protein
MIRNSFGAFAIETRETKGRRPVTASNVSATKKRWSYFIRKVYETDPLICPKCQGELSVINFIDEPDVIRKILQHLGLREESHASPGKI